MGDQGVVPSRKRWRHPDLPALVLGLLLALGVCWPLFGGGRTFLLDWVFGPHTPIFPASFFGLDGGLNTGGPFAVAIGAASSVLGAAATWLPIAAVFPVAALGMSRLVGGSQWARLGAATLFAVNPFVFQRIAAGQIGLLLGYAFLPFVVRSMLTAVDAHGVRKLLPVLWMALVTAMSPHFAWITAVLLLAVVVCHRRRLAALGWAALVGACYLVSLAYILLPPAGATLPSAGSLTTFQTSGDPRFGLFGNVVALYGFWRTGPGPVLPKSEISGWFLFLLAILVVAAAGVVATFRAGGSGRDETNRSEDPETIRSERPGSTSGGVGGVLDRRALVSVVSVAAVVGFFLALGAQGPTGFLFRWMFDDLPFFDIMREPEKFSMLLALGYAVCFGVGAERLAAGAVARRRTIGRAAVASFLAVGLPLAYTATLFNGLNGQIASSQLPASWSRAQSISGGRTGALLFLPWHEYLAFDFTQDRVIANPSPSSFTGEVISGTDPELDGLPENPTTSSAYLVRLLNDAGATGSFGAQLAPLGVQYVALSKTVDWRSYRWLSSQPSLRLEFDSPTLELWKNLAYRGIGGRGGSPVTRLSATAYRIPPGRAGQVTVAIPYQKGWSLNGVAASSTAQGTLTVRAGPSGGVLRFGPWRLVLVGDLVSLVVLGALGALCARDRWIRGQEPGTAPESERG